jgi:hypothetical protein
MNRGRITPEEIFLELELIYQHPLYFVHRGGVAVIVDSQGNILDSYIEKPHKGDWSNGLKHFVVYAGYTHPQAKLLFIESVGQINEITYRLPSVGIDIVYDSPPAPGRDRSRVRTEKPPFKIKGITE